MDKKLEEMVIETHTFCKMNHKALYGNGKAGLIERVDKAESAFKTARCISIGMLSILTLTVAIVAVVVS